MCAIDAVWGGEGRATVPSKTMEDCPDVQSPTVQTASDAPFPLGLGIYTNPTSAKPTPLPLFYVSPWAAAQRSPSTNIQKAPGVRSGWYVLAQPDRPFTMRISRVNDTFPGLLLENIMVSQILVDGVNANSFRVFLRSSLHLEYEESGFVDSFPSSESWELSRQIRPFSFASSVESGKETEHSETNKETGSIRLSVHVGVPVQNNIHVTATNFAVPEALSVSEKAAAKEGRSLRVDVSRETTTENPRLSKWTTKEARWIPEADVVIFVREYAWLRSRRIIDDEGRPCTRDMFRQLLRKDNGDGKKVIVVDIEDEDEGTALKTVHEKTILVLDDDDDMNTLAQNAKMGTAKRKRVATRAKRPLINVDDENPGADVDEEGKEKRAKRKIILVEDEDPRGPNYVIRKGRGTELIDLT